MKRFQGSGLESGLWFNGPFTMLVDPNSSCVVFTMKLRDYRFNVETDLRNCFVLAGFGDVLVKSDSYFRDENVRELGTIVIVSRDVLLPGGLNDPEAYFKAVQRWMRKVVDGFRRRNAETLVSEPSGDDDRPHLLSAQQGICPVCQSVELVKVNPDFTPDTDSVVSAGVERYVMMSHLPPTVRYPHREGSGQVPQALVPGCLAEESDSDSCGFPQRGEEDI